MQTSRKDNFKELTAEDIAAELLPLVREYFVGECRQEGGNLIYTLADGQTYVIEVKKA